jgi:hypothetical protein
MSTRKNVLTLFLATVLAFGLAACGGGSTTPDPVPEPTPYETAKAAIAAADTAEAAQAAYDAVKDDVTAAQGDMLQDAVDARVAALATMARVAAQKMALADAAGMIDTSDLSTQDLVDAARTAIARLRQAIADAVDVADTSMYQSTLDDAVDAVDTAQGGIDTATRRSNQMDALSGASTTLQAALAALSGSTPTQAQLDDANAALTALNDAITAGADLTDDEKAPYQREADNVAAPISTAQMAFDDAEDEADKQATAAMAALATKLYAGIGAPDATTGNAAQRQAAYSGTGNVDITVTWGAADTAQALTLDEDASVADRHGWTGQMFTAEPDGAGTYEAAVYSHVGDPTEGDKFSTAHEYDTTEVDGAGTELAITGRTLVAARIASPRFDQSAGVKEFELGTNMARVVLAGSYRGVPGTYYCMAAASSTCAAELADDGFNLGGTADADNAFTADGGSWTFKADDPETRLMDTPDSEYASYGWWLHKSEDGDTFIASAFHAYRDRGTAPAVEIAGLRGMATYTGGAAGKYSLRGSTGGTNDAGHFTADVELNATFATAHKISGTIDNFVGADGEERDWSVALSDSLISDAGAIAGDPDDSTDADPRMTTWTIGGTASDAAGSWSGNLREEGADGVPALATGTFYSTYGQDGNDGKMVGAFGADTGSE